LMMASLTAMPVIATTISPAARLFCVTESP
jgi:hypothetical protein